MELGQEDNSSPIEEGDRNWQAGEENNDLRTNLGGPDPIPVKSDWDMHERPNQVFWQELFHWLKINKYSWLNMNIIISK